MTELYVTEPDAINIHELSQLVPAESYEIVAGTHEFAEGFVSDAEVLVIRSETVVTSFVTTNFPNLQAIVRVGTGLDNVDLEFCKANNIAVFNAPGANADTVAEYVVAVILYARRRLHLLTNEDVLSWNRFKFSGEGLSGRTVGILGYGNIGRLLHKKLQGLGCEKFLAYDPYLPPDVAEQAGVDLVELDQALSESDIISLHLPLTDETKHMISDPEIALLRDGAILINASRGGVVDEAAIMTALEQKQLTYIADTVENEPHVNPELLKHNQIIVTPHIASLTSDSEAAMLRVAMQNFLDGYNR